MIGLIPNTYHIIESRLRYRYCLYTPFTHNLDSSRARESFETSVRWPLASAHSKSEDKALPLRPAIMTDDSVAEDAPLTFNVKSSSDAKYTITMPSSATVAELKEKLSTKDYADLPAERQRLIYSGRVLKDPDTLGSYNIKEGNTVHLVKGAASNQRQNPANQGVPAASAAPSNLSAGTGNNPLAGLTGARYAGFAQLPNQDMFGPDGGVCTSSFLHAFPANSSTDGPSS